MGNGPEFLGERNLGRSIENHSKYISKIRVQLKEDYKKERAGEYEILLP